MNWYAVGKWYKVFGFLKNDELDAFAFVQIYKANEAF